jgi:hypothetical protein
MTELYGKLANVPYVRKKYSNFMATIDVGHTQQDMPLFLESVDMADGLPGARFSNSTKIDILKF